jgi:nucleotide-binding universal stress UspA family protein
MSADSDTTSETATAAVKTGTMTASDAGTLSDTAADRGTDSAAAANGPGLFDRVLVVTGEGSAGEAAEAAAVELAAAHGAAVDALYVVDETHDWDIVVERSERTGEALVESVESAGAARGVDVEKWFRYGDAREEVLGFAAAHSVDLIVIGSARRTGIERLLRPERLPARVQRGADAPVMVVGPDDA